uniref:Type IV pilus assembly protein PilP n=1 Tax=uncultured prokaryote TaxID=198431 RepID=H5SKW4_9ZZZZ|nr:type IV pilus assembly protein PilP [uncultured prokaryote]
MKVPALWVVGLVSAGWVAAQTPAPTPKPEEKPIDTTTVERILAGEEEIAAGGGFTYDPAGRRDPFRSLLQGRSREELGERPPGLPGMGVEEIKLQGIIKLPEGYVALIQGTDNMSYIIKPGTVLYDGTVEKIEPGKVTFKVNVADPRSLKPYREVVRTLQ